MADIFFSLAACPFCGSARVVLRQYTRAYVTCDRCHATGPMVKRDDVAVKMWNEQKYGAKKRLEELFPLEQEP